MGNKNGNGNRGHLEIITFADDSTNEGVMVFPGAPPTEIEVERNERNDHLFLYNSTSQRYEVLHYGSALIVSLLRCYEPPEHGKANAPQTATHKRELALFNTDGVFHDHLILKEPLFPGETDSGMPDIRHTAFFDETVDESVKSFTIAIDDIVISSLAKPISTKQ